MAEEKREGTGRDPIDELVDEPFPLLRAAMELRRKKFSPRRPFPLRNRRKEDAKTCRITLRRPLSMRAVCC